MLRRRRERRSGPAGEVVVLLFVGIKVSSFTGRLDAKGADPRPLGRSL